MIPLQPVTGLPITGCSPGDC